MDDYKGFIEDIKDISKDHVIVSGVADIRNGKLENVEHFIFLGFAEDSEIKEAFTYIEGLEEADGEYEFDMVFKWYPGDYDECGRCTMRAYIEEKYSKYSLIQTFIQRERQEKIDSFFDLDFV